MTTNLERALRELLDFGWRDIDTLGRHKWFEFAQMAAQLGAADALERAAQALEEEARDEDGELCLERVTFGAKHTIDVVRSLIPSDSKVER